MIQFRLFNGDVMRHTFEAHSTLDEAFQHVQAERTDCGRPFVFMQVSASSYGGTCMRMHRYLSMGLDVGGVSGVGCRV
jgi:hypothetical protein